MRTDLRHALRALAQSRGTIALSMLCLAAGIGVVTMVFAVLNGLLLQPLPFHEPEQLIEIQIESRQAGADTAPISTRELDVWQPLQLPAALAAVRAMNASVGAEGSEVEQRPALATTWNLAEMLGLQPVAGRLFRPEDDVPGADGVVLIAESLWESAFAKDPSAVGRTMMVDGRPAIVIGVLPALSHPAVPGALRDADVWTPLRWIAPDGSALSVVARLAAPIDRASLTALEDRLQSALAINPALGDRVVRARPMDLSISPTTRAMLLTAMGAAMFVLLIGCANVATLMLVRSTARQREMATRIALGASRLRIARQLLFESAIVGLASVPAGLLLGWAGRAWLLRAGGAQADALPIDWSVAAAAIGAALMTSVLFGLAPVLQSMRTPARTLLAGGGWQTTPGRQSHRLRAAFAAAEIALSLALLVSASLLARSFTNLLDADRDLDPARVVVLGLGGPDDRGASPQEMAQTTAAIESRVAALGGVASTSIAEFLPLRRGGPRVGVRVDGRDAGTPPRRILWSRVGAGFFTTMGMDIEAGRALTAADVDAREPVAVVNRRAASLLWPGQNAVGRRIRLDGDPSVVYTVVGVSQNISNWDISGVPLPTAYVPLDVVPHARRVLIARAAGDAAALIAPVRDIAASLDRPPASVEPQLLDAVSYDAFARQRTLAVLFSVFSALSLLLMVVGVYGVLSCFVSQRRREIGIRAALGASRRALVWLVGRQTLATAGAGIAVGMVLAIGTSRLLRSLLFEVSATDPLSYNATIVVIVAVSAVAAWLPAHRAASTNPAVTLRG